MIMGVKAVIFFFLGEWGINPRRTTSFFSSEIKISIVGLASKKKMMQLYVDGQEGCVQAGVIWSSREIESLRERKVVVR